MLKDNRRDVKPSNDRAMIAQRLFQIKKSIDSGEEKLSQLRVILKLVLYGTWKKLHKFFFF